MINQICIIFQAVSKFISLKLISQFPTFPEIDNFTNCRQKLRGKRTQKMEESRASFQKLDKNSLLDELMRMNEDNRLLKEEIRILKDEYAKSVDIVPNMTELYNENTNLKKQIIEFQASNDDLRKRLKIAMDNNNDLVNKQNKNKSDREKSYLQEIQDLQVQLDSSKGENEKINNLFQKRIKELESENFKIQSESSNFQVQISKVLKVAGSYFDNIFKNTDELIEQLKNKFGDPEKKNATMQDYQNENEREAKIRQLKTKLREEKNKRNDLNLTILKLKKKLDHINLSHEEQIVKLQDHIRQQANEIGRLELLQQQKTIGPIGPVQPKKRNAACQVQLGPKDDHGDEIDELRRQLLNSTAQINDLNADQSTLKNKYDDLTSQINEMELDKTQLVDKLKTTTMELADRDKLIYKLRKDIEQQTIVNNELQDKLNQKEADSLLPQTQLATKLKIAQTNYKNAQAALDNMEKLFNEQKKEIEDLSENKEKLIMIIEKQNLLLNELNGVYLENQENAEPQIVEKIITVEPQFKWMVGDLPPEILDIVKEFAANDSLTFESRIKNIFFVINKWIEQQKALHEKEIASLTNDREKYESELVKYKADTIAACGDDEVNESNICEFITRTLNHNIDLQKELKEIKDNEQRILEKSKCSDFDTLIEKVENALNQNEKLIEKYDVERKKRIGMKKQFKEYTELKEKDFNEKLELSRRSKENSRKQIEKLQENISKLQEQNKLLIEQLKEHSIKARASQNDEDDESEREKQAELLRQREEERENELSMNISKTQKMNFENEELRSQITSLNKTIQSWQDAAKEGQDENLALQQKLDKQKQDYEKIIKDLNKKNEAQNAQNKEIISQLTAKIKDQADEHRESLEKLNSSLIESNRMYEKSIQDLHKAVFEKDHLQHTINLKLEACERAKKLSEAQLKAQILSVDSKYAMIVEEEKQKAEKRRRELIEYFISAFRQFANVDSSLNEESFKEVVRKVRAHFDKNERIEHAIRNLIKANTDEPIEDALTQFIIKNHPNFQV